MRNKLSKYIIIIIVLVWGSIVLNLKQWNDDTFFSYDFNNYYSYLPALIIEKDFSFNYRHQERFSAVKHKVLGVEFENGRFAPKMSMGVAILLTPFFILAHFFSLLFGFPGDGFSILYKVFITFGHLFYSALGLIYLRKVLLKYFSDFAVCATLVTLAFCTNFFHYSVVEIGMSHTYSFFLFVIFLWNVIGWHNNPNRRLSIITGIIYGLIVLVRPTNGLVAIMFILFNVFSLKSFEEKLNIYLQNKTNLIFLILFAIITVLPQILYWKYVADVFFFFSYGDEGFFFSNPQFYNGLFSYRKGWLIYTPVMIFSLVGIFMLYRSKKEWLFGITTFVMVNFFVVFSWWCWWYGASFGQRALIESYAVLAIPMAMFFHILSKKEYLRVISLIIIVFSGALNLVQTKQYQLSIHYNAMTEEAYWKFFYNKEEYKIPYEVNKFLKSPDLDAALSGDVEFNNPEYDKKQVLIRAEIIRGNNDWFDLIKKEAKENNENVDSFLLRYSKDYNNNNKIE